MEEKLIELARVKPALYDANHPDYFKGKVKQEIWKEIAKNLNLSSAGVAKSIWERLRNNHRDAIRRQRIALDNGVPPGAIKKWKYQKQMEFLLDYMNIRPFETNADNDQDVDKSQQEFECADEYLTNEDGVQDEENIIDYSDIPELYAESPSHTSDSTTSELKNSSQKKSNKKVKKDDGSASIEQQSEQTIKRKKLFEKDPSNDELYYFFMSMYKMTQKMPATAQHIVRKKVFDAVSQAEADLLDIQEIPQNSYQFNNAPYVTDAVSGNDIVKFLPGST